MFILGQLGGSLWKAGVPYPAMDSLLEEWRKTTEVEARKQVSFRMQELFNRQPTAISLYYPVATFAYRPAAYDNWAESPGFGIVHKWSFLPPTARTGTLVTTK